MLHFTCGIIVFNRAPHLLHFKTFISHFAQNLKELVLLRNHYDSWGYDDIYLDYIQLFCDIPQFSLLTFLKIDMPHEISVLRALLNFLLKCPMLTHHLWWQ